MFSLKTAVAVSVSAAFGLLGLYWLFRVDRKKHGPEISKSMNNVEGKAVESSDSGIEDTVIQTGEDIVCDENQSGLNEDIITDKEIPEVQVESLSKNERSSNEIDSITKSTASTEEVFSKRCDAPDAAIKENPTVQLESLTSEKFDTNCEVQDGDDDCNSATDKCDSEQLDQHPEEEEAVQVSKSDVNENVHDPTEGVDPNDVPDTTEGFDPNDVPDLTVSVDPNDVRDPTEDVDPTESVDPNDVRDPTEGVDPNEFAPISQNIDQESDESEDVGSEENENCEESTGPQSELDMMVNEEIVEDDSGVQSSAGGESQTNMFVNDEAPNETNENHNGNGNSGDGEFLIHEFEFPSELCGRLIGSRGRNINHLKDRSGAEIIIKPHPCSVEFQVVSVQGSQQAIDIVLRLIRSRFPRSHYTNVDLKPLQESLNGNGTLPAPTLLPPGMPPGFAMPQSLVMSLPEGVACDVMISSIVTTQRVFVQQPGHPAFHHLDVLNQCMLTCYGGQQHVPQLPTPVQVGTICAAPMMGGWFRAQVMDYHADKDICDVKYVDYGGFAAIPSNALRQIRADFMSIPFQAVEVYLAHIQPLEDEDEFSIESTSVLEELTRGYMLQLHVVGYDETQMPMVDLYNVSVPETLYVNFDLSRRGVVRWSEMEFPVDSTQSEETELSVYDSESGSTQQL